MSKVTLIYFISGMWCSTCSKSIEARLRRLPGVGAAQVNFSSKLLTVEAMNEDVDEEILREVERLGFGIRRQPSGWVRTFREDLKREHTRALSASAFAVVAFLAMWSSMIAFSGYLGGLGDKEELLVSYLSAALGIPAILIGMIPFARAGVRALVRSRMITLDLFIALGGASAVAVSITNLSTGSPRTYTDSAAMVLVVLLLAKLGEARLARYLSDHLLRQVESSDQKVETWFQERWVQRELSKIRRGSRVRFKPGQMVSLDGTLLGATSRINSHLLNGEAGDLEVNVSETVLAGSLARTDLEIEVTEPLGMRTIDRWAQSALISQGRAHAFSPLIDLMESRLTLAALLGAAGAGALGYARTGSPVEGGVAFFVGVLVFCPCLFAGIIPLTKQMAHLTLSRMGVMVHRIECLFDLNRVERIYLDKTGTLEAVDSFYDPFCRETEERVLTLLQALAHRHPVLEGLALQDDPVSLELEVVETPGEGLVARDLPGGDVLVVGRPRFVAPDFKGGKETYPLVSLNGEVVGKIVSRSAFNEISNSFLNSLLELTPAPVEILSGDPDPSAGLLFQTLDPERIKYRGNLSPDQKAELVEERALFLGDGLNDTPALARASVSCRLGQRVRNTSPSDLHLPSGNLLTLLDVITYSHHYFRVLKQTALLALSYNVIALTLAFAGLFTPLSAALAMLTSLLVLVVSSLRLLGLPYHKSQLQTLEIT